MAFSSSAASPGPYVLVINEDPAEVAFIIRCLRHDGLAVVHAYTGPWALELLHAMRVCDLVISDTNVDGISGTELIRQVRLLHPAQRILYLGSGPSRLDLERQLPRDVPILRKPLLAEALRTRVRTILPFAQQGAAQSWNPETLSDTRAEDFRVLLDSSALIRADAGRLRAEATRLVQAARALRGSLGIPRLAPPERLITDGRLI